MATTKKATDEKVTRRRTAKAVEPVAEPEHGQDTTPWGCVCGWRPNYGHVIGLGVQQQRHFEQAGLNLP